MSEERIPAMSFHPGEMLREEREARGQTRRELAHAGGIPSILLQTIERGITPMNAQIAEGLSRAWGTTAEMWMNLQTAHDLWLERTKHMRVEQDGLCFRIVRDEE